MIRLLSRLFNRPAEVAAIKAPGDLTPKLIALPGRAATRPAAPENHMEDR